MTYSATEAMIEAAERELGRALPRALRVRLSSRNGGEIHAQDDEWQLFPVWDASDRRAARRTANHVVAETQTARGWPRFPAGAVAIAANGTGDLLVVLPDEDDVALWRHDTGEVVKDVRVRWS